MLWSTWCSITLCLYFPSTHDATNNRVDFFLIHTSGLNNVTNYSEGKYHSCPTKGVKRKRVYICFLLWGPYVLWSWYFLEWSKDFDSLVQKKSFLIDNILHIFIIPTRFHVSQIWFEMRYLYYYLSSCCLQLWSVPFRKILVNMFRKGRKKNSALNFLG